MQVMSVEESKELLTRTVSTFSLYINAYPGLKVQQEVLDTHGIICLSSESYLI